MTLQHTNRVLMVVLAVVVLASALTQTDHSRPNYEIVWPGDMRYSPAYSTYARNDNFADRRTLHTPVPGTIARGAMPIHFEATPEDALRAGQELMNPYQPDSDEAQSVIARGGDVYRIYCTACHGGGGAGDGPVAQRGFPPPPSLLTGKSVQMKDGQLFHILTYGQGSMSSFAAQLSADRRWDVVNYVRSLQQQAAQDSAASEVVESAEPLPTTNEAE